MSQVEELERRITAALDRIAKGLEPLGASSGSSQAEEELAKARAELEDERLAAAQLEERIKTLHEKQDGKIADLEAQTAAQSDGMARLDTELQRLKSANEQLRASNAALRAANEKGVGEPHLINKAMLAELEGLRAARAADMAENAAILSALEPLLQAEEGA
jgi:chromosome segregation ATPase